MRKANADINGTLSTRRELNKDSLRYITVRIAMRAEKNRRGISRMRFKSGNADGVNRFTKMRVRTGTH